MVKPVKTRDRRIYWIATGLFSAFMLMNVGFYILRNEMAQEAFISLAYPAYLVYPLAVAKILGLIAILSRRSKLLKEWAYAGFFFDFLLAFFAHISVGDGEFAPALVALILLVTSRVFEPKVFA